MVQKIPHNYKMSPPSLPQEYSLELLLKYASKDLIQRQDIKVIYTWHLFCLWLFRRICLVIIHSKYCMKESITALFLATRTHDARKAECQVRRKSRNNKTKNNPA